MTAQHQGHGTHAAAQIQSLALWIFAAPGDRFVVHLKRDLRINLQKGGRAQGIDQIAVVNFDLRALGELGILAI